MSNTEIDTDVDWTFRCLVDGHERSNFETEAEAAEAAAEHAADTAFGHPAHVRFLIGRIVHWGAAEDE